ncbi:MAG: ribose-phosphate pyrophosphokinase [Lachnospiraceae bacterium]|nr:ribose-phosphate pyrophosphokinase [Lachnospiraceae bacterium]
MRGKPYIIALESARDIGEKVNNVLTEWHGDGDHVIPSECPRFGSGEGKGIIRESARDKDIYILVDVCNTSIQYKMDGKYNRMSPDDHYQDLKRVIAACDGNASRITVIMPFLYEGRQHRKVLRESLDCALMLRELENMGVRKVITFDAHDPRMQNVNPLNGLVNVSPSLQFTQSLFAEYEDIIIDSDHLMFVAPDEGATERVVFMATLFGVNIGMFYKRRDYGRIENGINPIVAHDFCGESVEGKDIIVIDDMISSGGSMIDVVSQLKKRGARRIFVFATFGLFTHGFDKFDKAYEEGLFDRIFTTNLIYQKPELAEKKYYFSVGMNRYIAAIIDTLNQGGSLHEIIKPEKRIRETVEKYKG